MRHHLKLAISPTKIQRIIRHHFGRHTTIARIATIHGGLFNTAYKIRLTDNRTVVLRIAPPPDKPLLVCETALLEREIYFQELVHDHALPAPQLLGADLSKSIINRNYIISEFREGQNAFYQLKHLTPRQQDSLYAELGAYAKRIHSIANPKSWFGAPPPLKRHRAWSDFVRWHAVSLAGDLQGHPYLSLPPHISVPSILDAMTPVLDEITTPTLIHADLWLRNILIDQRDGNCTITAILDWDRSLWGDPWFEWILHGLDLPQSFWKAYGSNHPRSRSHRQRRSLYKALGCLQASLEDSVHFHLKKQSRQMLAYAVANFDELLKFLR
jgi:aminoglycoside phosphotransferase (APT) family kinase protein